ncbi:MAG: hypothetical protein ACJ8OJ_01470 [Povalibacter sp.]
MPARSAETTSNPAPEREEGWTPEHQAAKMLGLCETQMDSALQESDRAVDTLVQAFTSLVDITRNVGALAEQLSTQSKAGDQTHELQTQLGVLSKQMASAVVAFQFYDKLTQRMGHVRYSLSALALFVCNRTQMQQPEQWQRLQSQLRRLYRTEAEREVFQMVMDGDDTSFIDAAQPSALAPASIIAGEIELF